jgi:hypothetical protein
MRKAVTPSLSARTFRVIFLFSYPESCVSKMEISPQRHRGHGGVFVCREIPTNKNALPEGRYGLSVMHK